MKCVLPWDVVLLPKRWSVSGLPGASSSGHQMRSAIFPLGRWGETGQEAGAITAVSGISPFPEQPGQRNRERRGNPQMDFPGNTWWKRDDTVSLRTMDLFWAAGQELTSFPSHPLSKWSSSALPPWDDPFLSLKAVTHTVSIRFLWHQHSRLVSSRCLSGCWHAEGGHCLQRPRYNQFSLKLCSSCLFLQTSQGFWQIDCWGKADIFSSCWALSAGHAHLGCPLSLVLQEEVQHLFGLWRRKVQVQTWLGGYSCIRSRVQTVEDTALPVRDLLQFHWLLSPEAIAVIHPLGMNVTHSHCN